MTGEAGTLARLPGGHDILPLRFGRSGRYPELSPGGPRERGGSGTVTRCHREDHGERDGESARGQMRGSAPVSIARALYERFKQLIHEFAKFGVVGVIGLFITNGGYDLLHAELGVGPLTSTTSATIVATSVAFLGNRQWTFRHRERTGVARESAFFFFLNGVGLVIQDAAVGFNYYIVGLHDKASGFIALNIGIAIATLFRFWSYRKWVWAGAPAGAATGRVFGRRLLGLRVAGAHASARGGVGRVDEVAQANGHGAAEPAAPTRSSQVG